MARAALHFWEEPCISGTRGSGAVFFTGCNLGCIYCQNYEIAGSVSGITVTGAELADIFLRLQSEGAHNINLVTAAPYVPQVAAALRTAKEQGLVIPVVYNSSGYECVETLRILEGLVDIWLPDFKYADAELAARYSDAPDYPEVALSALREMLRQAGPPVFHSALQSSITGSPAVLSESQKSRGDFFRTEGLMSRGVIVRHLLLPGHVNASKEAVDLLLRMQKEEGADFYISLMSQYTPMPRMADDPLLSRKVTRREYRRLLDYALEQGLTEGFFQEGDVAEESFIPAFDGSGVRPDP